MAIVKFFKLGLVFFVLIVVASDAQAQGTPAPAAQTAGWRDGFFIQSDNGDYRLQIGALVHADGRFALGSNGETAAVTDTFLIRRLRPYLRGRFARNFEFYINPDFAGGTLVLQDAYVDTVFSPAFRIRLGKTKTPFGLERLQPASNILFLERALPTSIVPNRDVGVSVLGDLSGGLVSYQAAVINGVTDGGSGDVDSNDGKDLAGRLAIRPFVKKNQSSPLRGLTAGIAGTWGHQEGSGALPTLRTASLVPDLLLVFRGRRRRGSQPLLAAPVVLPQGIRGHRRVRAHRDGGSKRRGGRRYRSRLVADRRVLGADRRSGH